MCTMAKFAEILVQRNENPVLPMGDGKHLVVSGITGPLTRPLDIMAACSQLRYCTSPDTSIQK